MKSLKNIEHDITTFIFYLTVSSCFNKPIDVYWQRFLHAYTKTQLCLEDHTHMPPRLTYKMINNTNDAIQLLPIHVKNNVIFTI